MCIPASRWISISSVKKHNVTACQVRLAAPEDCAAMAVLHQASLPEGWGEEVFAGWLKRPEYRLWLAEMEGMVAGVLVVRSLPPEAEIITLAVAEEMRRRGIARALFDEAIYALRQEGVTQCFLEVSSLNATAQALYASLGFTTLTTRRVYYADGTDALVMKREV